MSWFGGGNKKEEPAEKSFLADGGADLGGHDAHVPLGGGGGNAMQEIQQFGAALQQQILIQQVITEMSDRAFTKCVSSSSMKDPQLTGKEVACIQAATNKWLDTNEFLMGRLARKQQQQAQAAGGGFH